MNTKPLYCTQCKNTYNVSTENLKLMKDHDPSFDEKKYTKGCFFKDLNIIKRAQKNHLNSSESQ